MTASKNAVGKEGEAPSAIDQSIRDAAAIALAEYPTLEEVLLRQAKQGEATRSLGFSNSARSCR